MYPNSHQTKVLPVAQFSPVCLLAVALDVGVALTEKESGRRQMLGTIWIWALGGQGLLPELLQQLELERAQAE